MKKPQEWYNALEPSPNQVKAPTMKTLLNPDEQTPLSSTNSGKSMIAKANNRKLGLHLFFWCHSFSPSTMEQYSWKTLGLAVQFVDGLKVTSED